MTDIGPTPMASPDEDARQADSWPLFKPESISAVLPDLVDMPWILVNEARRVMATPFIWLGFRLHGIRLRKGWRIFGMPIIQKYRASTIEIGEQVEMRSWRSSNPLAPYHPVVLATRSASARIQLGYSVGLASSMIISATSIDIGDRVMVGANSTIIDTDFHPLDPAERRTNVRGGASAPVVIEDDVFIGMSCIILKGVRIGRGAVIGAGSVVSRDVPARMIAAGNPARVVGEVGCR